MELQFSFLSVCINIITRRLSDNFLTFVDAFICYSYQSAWQNYRECVILHIFTEFKYVLPEEK